MPIGLPRELRHANRKARRARENHDANRQIKHDNRRRRFAEMEQADPLRGRSGGIRSGNVARTKPRASLRSRGHR